jgi:hypothetical protein
MIIFLLLASYFNAAAQTDASWAREFASPSGQGRENALNGDPRFSAFLGSSLHQQQSFWLDHGHFTPVAELVHTFIGVPGSVLLDENRYVMADGCVPHDCYDRGMVWIDTAAQPAAVIFVATGLVSGSQGNATSEHLWLFSSTTLDWQNLPEAFRASLQRWYKTNQMKGYDEKILLVTLVQPNGHMIDVPPSMF